MSIREVADIHGAERYTREQLADGTTLAHLVLSRIDLSRGRFRIAIPDIVDQAQPFDFKSGILAMQGDEEMMVARVIKSFIKDPGCALLMQEMQPEPTDGLFKKYGENLVSYKDEPYWKVGGVESAQLSDQQMLTLLKTPSTNPFAAFFYLGTPPASKTLTDSDLERIVAQLIGLAVDALDFESFLLWWRDDLHPFPTV
jgi:hypothetical protein